jgi:hypothetical protein
MNDLVVITVTLLWRVVGKVIDVLHASDDDSLEQF